MPEIFGSSPEQRPTVEEKYKGHQTWQEAYERPDEVYTAKEIFDLIQTNEFQNLNPEKNKKELLEQGEKEEDIDLALQLTACIGALDAATFKKPIPLTLRVVSNDEKGDFFAAYKSLEKNPQEEYVTYVKDMHSKLKNQLRQKKIKLVDENNKLIKDAPLLSIEEFLLETAVHEVRHRLQTTKEYQMFLLENIENLEGPMKRLAEHVKYIFEQEIKLEQAGQNRKEKIEYWGKSTEFDAWFVDYFAAMKIHQGVTLQEFVDLVKIEPEK